VSYKLERSIQIITKGVASMLTSQQFLGNKLWNMALFAFVDVANVCPNAVSGEYSPEYHLTGRHIERRFKFTWGKPVVSLVLRRPSKDIRSIKLTTEIPRRTKRQCDLGSTFISGDGSCLNSEVLWGG
jgi:hypothetical protein